MVCLMRTVMIGILCSAVSIGCSDLATDGLDGGILDGANHDAAREDVSVRPDGLSDDYDGAQGDGPRGDAAAGDGAISRAQLEICTAQGAQVINTSTAGMTYACTAACPSQWTTCATDVGNGRKEITFVAYGMAGTLRVFVAGDSQKRCCFIVAGAESIIRSRLCSSTRCKR